MSDYKTFPLIHEIQVTNENVTSLLYEELLRLMYKYGRRVKEYLFALALGPNAFKAYETWGRTQQMIYDPSRSDGATRFHDVRIVCGPLPFIVPIFTEKGWHFAHQEAKRITDAIGGVDA